MLIIYSILFVLMFRLLANFSYHTSLDWFIPSSLQRGQRGSLIFLVFHYGLEKLAGRFFAEETFYLQGLFTEGFFWIPSLGGPTSIAARQSGSGVSWLFPFVVMREKASLTFCCNMK